ncbi:MAG: DUF6259 domain-containing protein [bacterium]
MRSKTSEGIFLENRSLRLVFNGANGCLESIFNKVVGKEFISFKAGRGLFKIIYPVEDVRSHSFEARDQKLSGHKIAGEGDVKVLMLRYDGLTSKRGSFKVSAEVRCELSGEKDEIIFTIKIRNDDGGEVSHIFFPLIGGLQSLGDDPEGDALLMPWFGGELTKNPYGTLPGKGEGLGLNESETVLMCYYPGGGAMQWMDYFSASHGLYMSCLNKEGQFLVLWMKKNVWDEEEHLSMAMVKYPYLRRGEWVSPQFMVSPHEGDWHRGADKYRTWFESWAEKIDPPQWLRYSNGWFHTMGRLSDGTTMNEIEEIPQIHREAKEHGLNIIFHCGWYKEGHDGRHPDYHPIDEGRLKRAYNEVHRDGGRLLLYVNGDNYCTSNPLWETEGVKWAVKRTEGKRGPVVTTDGRTIPLKRYGSSPAFGFSNAPGPLRWEWSFGHYPSFEGETVAIMCPSCFGWVDKILRAVRTAAELGADIVILDTIAVIALLCFDEEHDHKTYDSAWGPGFVNIMRKALELGRKINPDFSLCIEGICDIYTPYIGIYHSRIRNFPEAFRYTLPWVTGITGAFIDMGDFDKLYKSFSLGLPLDVEIYTHARGRFSISPSLAEEIKQLNKLRQDHRDFLVDGTFKDTIGVDCDAPSVSVKAFVKDKGILLTVWHRGERVLSPMVEVSLNKLGVKIEGPKLRAIPDDVKISRKGASGNKISFSLPRLWPGTVALIRIEGD